MSARYPKFGDKCIIKRGPFKGAKGVILKRTGWFDDIFTIRFLFIIDGKTESNFMRSEFTVKRYVPIAAFSYDDKEII